MLRILALLIILSGWPVLGLASSDVEIVAGGVHYPSLQAYKDAQAQTLKGPASNQDEQYLQAQSKRLGLAFDPKKTKTVVLAPIAAISEKVARKLRSIGYEHSLGKVMADFQQNWDNPVPKFVINSDELGKRLEALAGDRKGPVLVVAQDRKIRVMALDQQNVKPQ